MSDPQAPAYNVLLRGLHWLMFLLIVVAAAGGIATHYLKHEDPLFDQVMLAHKSLGLTLCGLVLLRVLIRIFGGTPPYKPALGPFNEKVAALAHVLLYAAMIGLPVTGYVMSMASKHEFAAFGLWPVPNYIPASEGLAKIGDVGHYLLAVLLGVLVALHLLAAVWHRLRGDGVYERMWPTAKA